MTRARINVRAAFLADILKSSLITDGTRVLLMHMATVQTVTMKDGHPMTDGGRIKVCREELADALGIDVGAVSDRIRKATTAGLIARTAGGQNGQVVEYQATPQGRPRGTQAPVMPESLSEFVNLLAQSADSCREGRVVGTPVGVPETASGNAVGTPASAPYARAHYSKCDAHPEPAPDGSRVERDSEVTEQDGNYRGWAFTPSERLSLDPDTGEAAA